MTAPKHHNEFYFLHFRFHAFNFSQVLPKDTVFIGTIRDPFSQLKSRFRQFGLAKQFGIPKGLDPIRMFLMDARGFETKQKIKEKKKGRNIYAMTRNFLLYQYGVDEEQIHDPKYVKSYIKYLDREFHFIAG